jgi:hypothetical protein
MTFLTEHKKAFGNLPDDIINKITNLLDLEPSDFTRIETHLYWFHKISKCIGEFVIMYNFIEKDTDGKLPHNINYFQYKRGTMLVRGILSLSYMKYGELLNKITYREGTECGIYYDDITQSRNYTDYVWRSVVSLNYGKELKEELEIIKNDNQQRLWNDNRLSKRIPLKQEYIDMFNNILIKLRKTYKNFLLYFSYYESFDRTLKSRIIKRINKDIDKINVLISPTITAFFI